MIRASKSSSLHQRRSKLLGSVAHQRETDRDFGLKPVTTSSTRQYHQSQSDPMPTYRIKTVAVVAVQVAVQVAWVPELYIVSYTRCDLPSTLMSSPSFRFN